MEYTNYCRENDQKCPKFHRGSQMKMVPFSRTLFYSVLKSLVTMQYFKLDLKEFTLVLSVKVKKKEQVVDKRS